MIEGPPFWKTFGFELERADEQQVVLRMDVPESLMTPFGRIHGGVLAALLDTALAIAVARRLEPTDRVATHNLNVSYVSFARGRVVHCHARALDVKRAVATAEGEVIEDGGHLVAKGVGVFGVYRRPARAE